MNNYTNTLNTHYKYLGYAQGFLLIPTILLLVIGVVMQYSCYSSGSVSLWDFSSFKAFLSPRPIRQMLWIIIGGICAFLVYQINYETIVKRYVVPVLIFSCLLLSYLALGSLFGKEFPFFGSTKGGYRWLEGPGFLEIIKIQPSEFAKLALTMYICSYFAKYHNLLSPSKPFPFIRIGYSWCKTHLFTHQSCSLRPACQQALREGWYGVFYPSLVMGSVTLLVCLGRSLSMTVLFVFQCIMLALCSGFRWFYLIIVFLLLAYGVWCGNNYGNTAPFHLYRQQALYQPVDAAGQPLQASKFNIINHFPDFFTTERLDRFNSWKYPELLQMTGGAQLWRSQLALGSGGMTGFGLGESRIKREYLPEAHNDFIISICGEEFGFVGTVTILILYAWLVIAAYIIAWLSRPHLLLSLSAIGLGLSLGGHAFINIGVASGFLPTTGITAPFLSYGGSSMIVSLVTIGLLLNIAKSAYHKSQNLDLSSVALNKK